MAHLFERLIAVESNAAAARDLDINLQESGAPSPASKESDVTAFLTRWKETPDYVLVDPPRGGVLPQALQRLVKLNPGVIAYLSCDPATLARDLALLVGSREKPGKYMIDSVYLVDMFPQSYHLEAFVRLIRRE
jgi:23S rRNA (uracil1939-C5)-methyltransferase